MDKKILSIVSLLATLTLTGCNLVITYPDQSSYPSNNKTSTSEISSSSSTSSNSIDEDSQGQDQEEDKEEVILKERIFSKETLNDGSIIPTSFTPTGCKLELDDLKIFANNITYEAVYNQKIYLRKNRGYIRNLNPIKNLTNINFTNLVGNLSLYVSNEFESNNWTKIDSLNGFTINKTYNYFVLANQTSSDISFEEIKLNYFKCNQNIVNEVYCIKNVNEISDESQAKALITTSNEPFVNDDKWTKLGYASNLKDASSRTINKLSSGYNQAADWQIQFNPEVVLNESYRAYRVVDMQYGDNGNSFRINMLDGTPGPVIYKGAAYTYIEDIAAYVTAFGDMPINTKYYKESHQAIDDWGLIGRTNYADYSNKATGSFKYETTLITHREYFSPIENGENYYYRYFESDYGADSGNDEPAQILAGWSSQKYNNGNEIKRGALRFVWTHSYTYEPHSNQYSSDILEPYNRNIFYTNTHYNDFQQYLNYYGGWSLRFGNTTLGNDWGKYVSGNHYKSSPKVMLTSLENISK